MPHRRLTEADAAEGTFRAKSFALLTGVAGCRQCRDNTHASTVLLRGYERFNDGEWVHEPKDALLTAIYALDATTYQLMATEAPWMLFAHSQTSGTTCLAAYCEHCSAVQGPHHLTEPEGLFFPVTREAAAQLAVKWFHQPMLAHADACRAIWSDWLPTPSDSYSCA
jgi:hypothetical protein